MTFLDETFVYPWALLGVLVVPLFWRPWLGSRSRAAIRFSGLSGFRTQASRWSSRARFVTPLCRSLAVMLLVVCIARPRKADEQTRIQTEGIAIQLVVDRSGSMENSDFLDEEGRKMTRLDAVKQVVKAFVAGDDAELEGRPDDLIGLTVFARYPDTECPPTRDHSHLLEALENVKVPSRHDRAEHWTAIGDALMQATERIRKIGRRLSDGDVFTIKSRVIVLLTDGDQTAGEFSPLDAAEVAASLGVKVYTIGATPETVKQRVGFSTRSVPAPIDEETLRQVAKRTGAKYFRATDTESLTRIYAEIDKLERTVIDEQRYEVYTELATHWISFGAVTFPPPLMVALAFLAIEAILVNTWFRRIP